MNATHKAALLLAGAALCAPAHANVCAAYGSATGPASFVDADTPALIPCAPSQIGGTGIGAKLRITPKGAVGWMWCPRPGGTTQLVWLAATPAMITAALPDVPGLVTATDTLAALRAFSDKHGTKAIDDPALLAVWCPYVAEITASKPKPWIIRPITGATYRSTYPLRENGTRNPTASGRTRIAALDGTPTRCDCFAAKVVEPTKTGQIVTYCAVTPAPITVANCKQAP